MKNLLLFICITFFLNSCDRDNLLFGSSDQLPPETKIGANTAGCLVNGNVFIPHQEGLNAALYCNYEFIDGKFYFNLVINDSRGTGVKTVSVRTSEITLAANTTYLLNVENTIFQPSYTGGGGVYGINASDYYYTTSLKTGELKITRVDLQNSIISGTFWFDAINAEGETVEIRSGRFDIEY